MSLTLVACASAPPAPSVACTDVESKLVVLDHARPADAQQQAQQLGLRVEDGRVQLALILSADDPGILDKLGLEGSGRGTRYQAWVPFDRICEIASLPAVVAVRAPAPAFEQ
jgi:hypothetical protein